MKFTRTHAIWLIGAASLLCLLAPAVFAQTLVPCTGDAVACARTSVNIVPIVPPAPPVDCVTEPVPPGTWQAGMSTSCMNDQQFVPETRPLQVVTQPSNGGVACPIPLMESRTMLKLGCSLPPSNNWPAPAVPFTTARLQLSTERPVPPSDGVGAFRVQCRYSHFNKDDAIALNGQQGASHLHEYCGNARSRFDSTNQNMFPCDASTSHGGTLNCSSYWTPAMLNGNTPLIPTQWLIYYKSGYAGTPPNTITIPKNGLRIIAGNSPTASGPVDWWNQTTSFQCVATGVRTQEIPDCPAGSSIIQMLDFPNCWDGVQLDEPVTHRRHMAYSGQQDPKRCPSTHPVPIPTISYQKTYAVGAGGTANWRLASDTYAALRPDGTKWPGGYSMHGDIWVNWDEKTKTTFVNECVRFPRNCHGDNIGNLVAFPPNGQRVY